tara:strand:- start:198 stop:317 length:120 start_codon:yes stop_codon:yes gene_type:complete
MKYLLIVVAILLALALFVHYKKDWIIKIEQEGLKHLNKK